MSTPIFTDNKYPTAYSFNQLEHGYPCFNLFSKLPPKQTCQTTSTKFYVGPNEYIVKWKTKDNTTFGTVTLYYKLICVKSFSDLPIGSMTTEGTIIGYDDEPIIAEKETVIEENPMDKVDFNILPKDEKGRIPKDALKPFMARFNLDDKELGIKMIERGYKLVVSHGKRFYVKEG